VRAQLSNDAVEGLRIRVGSQGRKLQPNAFEVAACKGTGQGSTGRAVLEIESHRTEDGGERPTGLECRGADRLEEPLG
jgi:hypothetical protein